jgi:AcrR family transcriptional regulator
MPRAARAAHAARPRRRRDAAASQAAILDAAEVLLAAGGASGIRLQQVAADAGVSHPTVLHHFGSREGLVTAVVNRALGAIHTDLVAAIQASSGGEERLAELLEAVFAALTRTGRARVLLWLALEGHSVDEVEVRLSDVVDATHALRTANAKGRGQARGAGREDTARTVVLASLALVAGAVMLPSLLENAGLPGDEAGGRRFRAWLARVLRAHLEPPGERAP